MQGEGCRVLRRLYPVNLVVDSILCAVILHRNDNHWLAPVVLGIWEEEELLHKPVKGLGFRVEEEELLHKLV